MKIRKEKGGVLLKKHRKRILIDPDRSSPYTTEPDVVLVSHAHTDHIRGLKRFKDKSIPVILSPETYNLLNVKDTLIGNPLLVDPGQVIETKGFHIRALRSGHTLGSLQFVISAPFLDKKVAYTGDFNLESSLLVEGAENPEADIILLDSTYGNPHYIMPKRKNLYPEICSKLKTLINQEERTFLHGYPLGKAQELTLLANEITPNVGVSERINKYNKALEKNGKNELGEYKVNKKAPLQIKGTKRKKDYKNPSQHIAFTGWATRRNYSMMSFPLSGHSDFLELLQFVGETDPEIVITLYSFKRQFAGIVEKRLGIKAFPLMKDSSKKMIG